VHSAARLAAGSTTALWGQSRWLGAWVEGGKGLGEAQARILEVPPRPAPGSVARRCKVGVEGKQQAAAALAERRPPGRWPDSRRPSWPAPARSRLSAPLSSGSAARCLGPGSPQPAADLKSRPAEAIFLRPDGPDRRPHLPRSSLRARGSKPVAPAAGVGNDPARIRRCGPLEGLGVRGSTRIPPGGPLIQNEQAHEHRGLPQGVPRGRSSRAPGIGGRASQSSISL